MGKKKKTKKIKTKNSIVYILFYLCKMPIKPSALSLKECSLNQVALKIELICYGQIKGSKELAKFINDEDYLKVAGPFSDWPTNLLEELAERVYAKRSGQKHLLHLIIQPQ